MQQPNPYSPPKAEVSDQPGPPASPVKAVLLGLAVDAGGSLLASTTLGIVYAFIFARTGASPAQIGSDLRSFSPGSLMTIVSIVVGTAMSVLGGYTCARVSRRQDYTLGFILGGLSITTGLLLSSQPDPTLTTALLSGLTFGAVLLGTRIGMVKVRPTTPIDS